MITQHTHFVDSESRKKGGYCKILLEFCYVESNDLIDRPDYYVSAVDVVRNRAYDQL